MSGIRGKIAAAKEYAATVKSKVESDIDAANEAAVKKQAQLLKYTQSVEKAKEAWIKQQQQPPSSTGGKRNKSKKNQKNNKSKKNQKSKKNKSIKQR